MNKITLTVLGDQIEVYGIVTTSNGVKVEIIDYFHLNDGFVEYDGFGPYIMEEDPDVTQKEAHKLSDDFIAQILVEESKVEK